MKRIMWVVGVLILLSGVGFAQQMKFSADKYKAVYAKAFDLDRLSVTDIPSDYTYTASQDSKNLFHGLMDIAAKNPKSFNAAWNYALLVDADLVRTDNSIDEAYKLYEKAKKLRPGDAQVYTRQIGLVYTKIWGENKYFPNANISDEEIIATYKAVPDQARKMLGLIEREISLLGITPEAGTVDPELMEHVSDAYYICKALNRHEAAAKWKKMKEASEHAYRVSRQSAYRGVMSAVQVGAKSVMQGVRKQ